MDWEWENIVTNPIARSAKKTKPTHNSRGSLSYFPAMNLPVTIFPEVTSRLQTKHFALLPSMSFLCLLSVPPKVHAKSSTLELTQEDSNRFKTLDQGIGDAMKLSRKRRKVRSGDNRWGTWLRRLLVAIKLVSIHLFLAHSLLLQSFPRHAHEKMTLFPQSGQVWVLKKGRFATPLAGDATYRSSTHKHTHIDKLIAQLGAHTRHK